MHFVPGFSVPPDFWSSLVSLTLNAFRCLVLAASFMTHSSSGPFTMDSSVVCLYFLPRDDNAESEISLVGFVGVKQSARDPRTSLTFGFARDLVELPTSSERIGVKNRLRLSIAACSWPRILLLPARSTEAPLCGPL